MPIYEYECIACGAHHEIMQKFSDPPLSECPACGGKLRKLISNTSFVLKGSGWYVTDYASPERKKAAEAEKQGGETKASETKTEAKAETKTEPKSNGTSEAKSGATASDK
jgi:putative FmdB family regulatory protein